MFLFALQRDNIISSGISRTIKTHTPLKGPVKYSLWTCLHSSQGMASGVQSGSSKELMHSSGTDTNLVKGALLDNL